MSGLFDLSGKVALVTGGTRGIGLGIAEAFAMAGASVMVTSEDAAACSATEQALLARGFRVAGHVADVAAPGAIAGLVSACVGQFGGLDIVVGNAGITGQAGRTTAIDPSELHRVMSINLEANVLLASQAAPHLKARGGGSFVFMSSLSAARGNGFIGSYALSKAALAQLARNLAVELGPDNIRANAIAPGLIRTDLARDLLADEAFMARRMQMTPLRRPGEIREIAGTALYLASPAGAFTTGQLIVVDGGTLVTDGS
jgi:NAD(P)-dependent dehydrogenase (short-subunit alcohol dehydrogenase family)